MYHPRVIYTPESILGYSNREIGDGGLLPTWSLFGTAVVSMRTGPLYILRSSYWGTACFVCGLANAIANIFLWSAWFRPRGCVIGIRRDDVVVTAERSKDAAELVSQFLGRTTI